MRAPLLLPLLSVLVILPQPALADPTGGCCARDAGHAEFLERVHAYANLHRTVTAGLGPEEMCGDPDQLHRNVAEVADAIRAARANARAGDVFTPRAAAFFRAALASAARSRYDVPAILEDMNRDGEPAFAVLEVNADFPWIAGNVMPPGLLRILPELPPEMEYRFVGGDLVLIDVRANLVVDVLERALPVAPSGRHDRAPSDAAQPDAPAPRQPCDVHPEMPGCWM